MNLFSTDRLLVPIDFSEAAFQAQEESLQFVERPEHLHLLHVLPHLNPGDPGVLWHTVDPQTRKQHVEQVFRDRYPDDIYNHVHFSVVIGNPAEEILRYAQQQDITLIVIPSHGRTGLPRFVIGSVAERVVRQAHCPVLVVRR